MKLEKTINNNELTIAVSGRLDTMTAPELDNEIRLSSDSITSLVLDFANLEYVSSAGLRVILSIHKTLSKKEGLVVKNVNETVAEVFEVTGFSDILTIE